MTQRLRMTLMTLVLATCVFPAVAAPLRAVGQNLGDANADLLFTPMNPCRVADTRLGGGFISGGTTRNIKVVGTTSLVFQGGTSGGCGVPVGAAAVEVNVVAVSPDAIGNLRGAAYPGPIPTNGAIINYQKLTPPLNVSNAIILQLCDPSVNTCTFDISLLANGGGTHVIIDVVGYFRRFPKEETIMSVAAGNGMAGGGSFGDVFLGIADFGVDTLQLAGGGVTPAKIDTTGAADGQVLRYQSGTVSWQTPAAGTITGVTAGAGLTGGGTSGNVPLAVAFGTSGSANTASHANHRLYARVIIVSPAATPQASGLALAAAFNSITTATATTRFLIKIEPGIYELSASTFIQFRAFVDVEGSGEAVTLIRRVDLNGGGVTVANETEWRYLTVESVSSITNVTAIGISGGTNARLSHVTARASGLGTIGINIGLTGTVVLEDVNVISNGSSVTYGVSTAGAAVTLSRVNITATSATSAGAGLLTGATAVVVADHLNILVSGTANDAGVSNGGTVTLTNSVVDVSGSFPRGIDNIGNVTCINVSVTARLVGAELGANVYALDNFLNDSGTYNVDVQSSTLVAIRPAATTFSTAAVFTFKRSTVTSGSMTTRIHGSVLSSSSNTVSNNGSGLTPVRISNSRMAGAVASAGTVCTFVYDENFTAFTSTCP